MTSDADKFREGEVAIAALTSTIEIISRTRMDILGGLFEVSELIDALCAARKTVKKNIGKRD
jgi:hypothetical protein